MITVGESIDWHKAADHAADHARTRIYEQLSGVPLNQDDRVFVARTARDDNLAALAALLAKTRASLDTPAGAVPTRFTFNGNTVPAEHADYDPHLVIHIDRHADGWMIPAHPDTVPTGLVWNYRLNSWMWPEEEPIYAREFVRPLNVAAETARRMVGLDRLNT
ncbi:hypothetical protein ACSDR0_48915 [Streptosporangium sp. G11]|uniref:hypothetical protein n=1 Tax=Streptosporangium sp. G11 TaxID=3436926 RepID=UPI003EBB6471